MNKWLRMTAMGALLPVLLVVSLVSMAAAPPDLAGVWQGKLAVDAKTSLTIQFTFAKDAKGAYTAVLNSPDNEAIKNMAATGVTWDGNALKLQVAALQGSYSGAMKDGALSGQWTQPGSTLPLVLAPYQKPVVSKAAAAQIDGAWNGPLAVRPNTTLMAQFRFKTDAKGELTGTFSIPDQGLVDSPVTNVEFADGKLSLRIPRANNSVFEATLANNQLSGKLKITGPGTPPDGIPVVMKKGEYAAVVPALKLTAEQFATVNGKWQGKLEITPPNGQKVTLTMVFRFSTNANGQYVGFVDSPDQKATNIAITEATLAAGKLTLKVGAVGGEYNATVAGNTMTGDWTQGAAGLRAPLVMTKQ